MYLFIYFLFRATPTAHESSQAKGSNQSYSCRLQPRIRAASATDATAQGSAGSLTHWSRSGMEPASSWILVGLVATAPQRELPISLFLFLSFFFFFFFAKEHDRINRYAKKLPWWIFYFTVLSILNNFFCFFFFFFFFLAAPTACGSLGPGGEPPPQQEPELDPLPPAPHKNLQ